MKSFISMWIICSIVIMGMMCVDSEPKIFLKDMTNPKVFELAKKNDGMSFAGKVAVVALGPLALGMTAGVFIYQTMDNQYKLEQLIKESTNNK